MSPSPLTPPPSPLPAAPSTARRLQVTDACFAAYRTIEIAGVCMPTVPLAQSEYDAAGVPVISTDLADLRAELTASAGRAFASAAGDVLAAWPVLLGCALAAVLIACAYAALVLRVPVAAYVIVSLFGAAGLIATSAILWSRGAARLTQTDQADLDAFRMSASGERDAGIVLCVVAVVYACATAGFFPLVRPALPLMQPASHLLAMAPLWPLAPFGCLVLLCGFLAFWLMGLALVASSSEIEVRGNARRGVSAGALRPPPTVLRGLWPMAGAG